MKLKPARQPGKVEVEFTPDAEPRIAAAFLNAWHKVPPMKLRKILATTDFSELSIEAVEYAVALARQYKASLSLINVVQPSIRIPSLEKQMQAGSDAQILKTEKKFLSKLAKDLSVAGTSIKPLTRYGNAFQEITEAAREQRFDLIVTATHGYTGLRRALIGSTAERVVRHAPCPVLTVPADTANRFSGDRWAARIRKIMVPVDFSETSAKALSYAVALASDFRAEVHLIHVSEPPPVYGGFDYLPSPAIQAAISRPAEELLSRVQREAFPATIPTEAIVRSGTPFLEISRAAARSQIDLIILTTHGRTGLKHAFMGSTAERIVRHASCPVLVVRGKETAA